MYSLQYYKYTKYYYLCSVTTIHTININSQGNDTKYYQTYTAELTQSLHESQAYIILHYLIGYHGGIDGLVLVAQLLAQLGA